MTHRSALIVCAIVVLIYLSFTFTGVSSRKAVVPCSCPACSGEKVSVYIRQQHSRRYILGQMSDPQNPLELKVSNLFPTEEILEPVRN